MRFSSAIRNVLLIALAVMAKPAIAAVLLPDCGGLSCADLGIAIDVLENGTVFVRDGLVQEAETLVVGGNTPIDEKPSKPEPARHWSGIFAVSSQGSGTGMSGGGPGVSGSNGTVMRN